MTRPPSVEDTARHFNISTEEASELYRQLHHRHAIFLVPETLTVRMANPFSAIPTAFKVQANGKTYYASCAWDMLGIPAALHTDAIIEAVCTESNDAEAVQLEIKDGQITINHHNNVTLNKSKGSLPYQYETLPGTCARGKCRSQQPLPQSDMSLVHFPLPFARWYDDLAFT
jgi:hypothetical protein